jgi:hypothetical protein
LTLSFSASASSNELVNETVRTANPADSGYSKEPFGVHVNNQQHKHTGAYHQVQDVSGVYQMPSSTKMALRVPYQQMNPENGTFSVRSSHGQPVVSVNATLAQATTEINSKSKSKSSSAGPPSQSTIVMSPSLTITGQPTHSNIVPFGSNSLSKKLKSDVYVKPFLFFRLYLFVCLFI